MTLDRGPEFDQAEQAPPGDRRQEPPLFLPLAAGQRDVPVRLPQGRAGQERRRNPRVRPARRGKRERDRQAPRADDPHLRTQAGRLSDDRDRNSARPRRCAPSSPGAARRRWRRRTPRPTSIPTPKIERKSFQVADGFEVNLFAADPLLAKPIQMNFDPAGRLWVAMQRGLSADQARRRSRTTRSSSSKTPRATAGPTRSPSSPTACSSRPASCPATAASTSPTAPTCFISRTPTATARPTNARWCCPASAPRTRTTWSTPCAGGRTGMLYFNQSVYIHSHIETPHGVRRLNGGGIWQFRPETMRAGRLLPRLVEPVGPSPSTAGASRSSPTAPAARASTTASPAPPIATAVGVAARPARASTPAAPRTAAWRSSAAGTCPTTGRATCITNDFRGHRVCRFVVTPDGVGLCVAGDARTHQDESPGVPADRRQDGAGRRDLHRRLVQPDHPARRGRFPRPAPRPDARPHLARHRQGPPAGRAAEAGRCQGRGPAGGAEGAGGLDAAAGPARDAGARGGGGRAGPGGVGRRSSTPTFRTTSRPCSKHCGRIRPSTSSNRSCWRRCCSAKDYRVRAAAVRVAWRLERPAAEPAGTAGAARRATTSRRCGWRRCGRWRRSRASARPSWRWRRWTGRWTSGSTTPCG